MQTFHMALQPLLLMQFMLYPRLLLLLMRIPPAMLQPCCPCTPGQALMGQGQQGLRLCPLACRCLIQLVILHLSCVAWLLL